MSTVVADGAFHSRWVARLGEVGVGQRVDRGPSGDSRVSTSRSTAGPVRFTTTAGVLRHAEQLQRTSEVACAVRAAPSTVNTCGSETPSPVRVIASSVTSAVPVAGRPAYAADLGASWPTRSTYGAVASATPVSTRPPWGSRSDPAATAPPTATSPPRDCPTSTWVPGAATRFPPTASMSLPAYGGTCEPSAVTPTS